MTTEIAHDEWCPVNGCRCGKCGPCMGPPLCGPVVTPPDPAIDVQATAQSVVESIKTILELHSDVLPSGSARKKWHRDHKASVLSQSPGEGEA